MTSEQHSERTIEIDTATLRASFLRSIPRQFQAAAEKLELDLVLEAHLKQTSTPLGKLALAKELIPTLDRQKIITSLTEIDELRTLLSLSDTPSFSGVSDIRTILHKVEL
ncbi:MAG TPA: hypothetical protein VFO76_12140, partial [Candidatus Kapabacteria bacterium]|nr:hypothetical protein [Candidatus Kapabacteria bacterium]